MSDLSNPETRTEQFLARAAGFATPLPSGEYSRLERYLALIAEGGGSGDGDMQKSVYDPEGAVAAAGGIPAYGAKNYAPAGYGLGETTGQAIPSDADLNDFKLGGWYTVGSGATNNPVHVTCALEIIPRASITVQRLWVCAPGPNFMCQLIRNRENDTWSEWEWVNPPLVLNTEYRTTERYLGKPVYVKVVNAGTFDSGTSAAPKTTLYTITISNLQYLVSCNSMGFGPTSNLIVFPHTIYSTSNGLRFANVMPAKDSSGSPYIAKTTNWDLNVTVYATLKYTKTTD